MGMQSGVVAVMGLAGVSTTYLTGTLTTLIDSLASPRPRPGATAAASPPCARWSAGAALSGLLLATVPAAVPAVPLVMLAGAIVDRPLWLRPPPGGGGGRTIGPVRLTCRASSRAHGPVTRDEQR